jgi:formate dehydrogenase
MIDLILRTSSEGDLFGLRRGGVSIAKLERDKPNGVNLRPEVPTGVIGDKLRTPGRKIDLAPHSIRGELARMIGQDPDLSGGALRLIGMRETHSHNSWMHNVAGLAKRNSGQRLRIHPDDAAAADLTTGERALITSPAASISATVEVTDDMFPGNVALAHGWGHSGGWQRANARDGSNSNLLSGPYPGCVEPLSGMSVLNGIPVTVCKQPVTTPAEGN